MTVRRWALVLAGVLACSQAQGATAAADPEALRTECDYGVTLALAGRDAAAESVFISLLTHAPGDPRALTNLGNLNLLHGELDVALAFYERAAGADTLDAGILLNEATALMLKGEEELAEARAREAVALAGGTRNATRLLGLRAAGIEEEAPKSAERAYVNKDELISLLQAAMGKVPADSVRAERAAAGTPSGGSSSAKPKRRPMVSRSAGARASEGTDAAAVVYWKR